MSNTFGSRSDAPAPTEPAPRGRATKAAEAAGALSFATYMERCLYDADFGYYTAGKVTFGKDEHFWTYPQRLSPLFGWMLAETARGCFEALLKRGDLSEDIPLTILELGAGNGDLARDALDYIAACADTPRWKPLVGRIRYVIGERADSLRERQRTRLAAHIKAGRAEVRQLDAIELNWEGPFKGLVVANELIDAFPCELIRIHGPEEICRVHVIALIDAEAAKAVGVTSEELSPVPESLSGVAQAGEMHLSNEGLWRQVSRGRTRKSLPVIRLVELEMPLALGWWGDDGVFSPSIPTALSEYLEVLAPMIADLEAHQSLPAEVCWAPGAVTFIKRLGALLCGDDREGLALLVDYGGTSRHVLDPNTPSPHLRVYSDASDQAHKPLAYEAPGEQDITWDIDFSEVARLATQSGLEPRFFGHQSILEAPPIDLWSKDAQRHLIRGRVREGTTNIPQAIAEAHALMTRFREAAGFRTILLSSPGVPIAEHFTDSDPFDEEGLWTISPTFNFKHCEEFFAAAGIPEKFASFLKPCGDPIADLCDWRGYKHRHAALEVLRAQGWLIPPGTLAEHLP